MEARRCVRSISVLCLGGLVADAFAGDLDFEGVAVVIEDSRKPQV